MRVPVLHGIDLDPKFDGVSPARVAHAWVSLDFLPVWLHEQLKVAESEIGVGFIKPDLVELHLAMGIFEQLEFFVEAGGAWHYFRSDCFLAGTKNPQHPARASRRPIRKSPEFLEFKYWSKIYITLATFK